MSARDELPPCRCIDHYPGSYLPDECRSCRALGTLRITREELATMRAAVERCAELEALWEGAAKRAEAALDHARGQAGAAVDMWRTAEAQRDEAVERCAELETALARVTAERDEARRAHARAVLGNGDSAHVHDGTCPRKIVHVTTPEECAAVFWGQAEADRLFGRTPAKGGA